jgi:hypothetical protein
VIVVRFVGNQNAARRPAPIGAMLAWRRLSWSARAADGDIAVDRDGRVHAAGVKAIPDPASLVEPRL